MGYKKKNCRQSDRLKCLMTDEMEKRVQSLREEKNVKEFSVSRHFNFFLSCK